MYRLLLSLVLVSLAATSCSTYVKEQKMMDSEYKYEAAKAYFFLGQYARSQMLGYDVLAHMKGSLYGDESLFMVAMSFFGTGDYDTASEYFRKYYQSYPRGRYAELSRYYCARSLHESTLDPRLDQQATLDAIREVQEFIDLYPYTYLRNAAHDMLLQLQDKLVEKELGTAQLYYDLGSYMGNSYAEGSNYEACIVTCQNALKDYPYASQERREAFSYLLLRSRLYLARESVNERKMERYRATIDEYYSFVNEFPDSRHLVEAQKIFTYANRYVESNGGYSEDDDI